MKRNNKNPASTFIVVAIAGMIFLSIFSTAVVARRITDPAPLLFTYSFLEPVVQRNSDGYDIISIEGLSLSTNSGEPSLPVLGLQIPLPLNKKIKDIKVTGDSTYLGADFCIEPGRESIPL